MARPEKWGSHKNALNGVKCWALVAFCGKITRDTARDRNGDRNGKTGKREERTKADKEESTKEGQREQRAHNALIIRRWERG